MKPFGMSVIVEVATVDSLALRLFAWRCGLLSLLHAVAWLGLWSYESLWTSGGTRLFSTAQAFLVVDAVPRGGWRAGGR